MRNGRRRWHWFAIVGCIVVAALAAAAIPMSGGTLSPAGREVGRRVVSLTLPSPSSTVPPADAGATTNPSLESSLDSAPQTKAPGAPPAREVPELAGSPEGSAEFDGPAAPDAVAPEDEAGTEISGQWHVVEVAPGDSLYSLFIDLGLSVADLARILGAGPEAKVRLSRLRPGETLEVDVDANGRVQKLVYHFARSQSLHVERGNSRFRSRVMPRLIAAAGEATLSDSDGEPSTRNDESIDPTPMTIEDGVEEPPAAQPREPLRRHLVTVKRGDSLYSIFQAAKLPTADLAQMLKAGGLAARLKRIRPGQRLEFHLGGERSVERLLYHRSETEALQFSRTAEGYDVLRVEAVLRRELANASGTVESSLFLAGQKVGLTDRLIMEMAEIFGWDIDFALDIREGDGFTLIYEELYKDGHKLRDGTILAAEFVNRGRVIRAVRYVDPQGRAGYYSPEGMSMRKAFLRSPVRFARISSRFSRGRRHPVLHTIRAHRGVDYAAPAGTPIRASGDGRVTYVGRKGGYGNTVVLQHGSTYTTLYAHMSRYAKGMRNGRQVRQGQVIGYVGRTGLATGSHLHYEFRVRGVHRDPLSVKLPSSLPIAPEHRAEFLVQTRDLVVRLDGLTKTQLAANE